MSKKTDLYFAYFCDVNDKVNDLLAMYTVDSDTRPFSYEDQKVFDAFGKETMTVLTATTKRRP